MYCELCESPYHDGEDCERLDDDNYELEYQDMLIHSAPNFGEFKVHERVQKFGAEWCRGPGAAPQRGEKVMYTGSQTAHWGPYTVEDMYPDDGRGSHCLYTIVQEDGFYLRNVGCENLDNRIHYIR